MTNQAYIPISGIAAATGITPGSMLVLTADLTRLAFAARRHEGAFRTEDLIVGFLDLLGAEGTLAIPSYNFNLRDGDHFSRKKTLPVTGALASAALGMEAFSRSGNPLHSFLAAGKMSGEIASLNNKSSFGSDSPFAFFLKHGASMLVVGVPLSEAFTMVHHAEETDGVKYRTTRKMKIFLEDERRWAEYSLFSKKPGWTMDMAGLEQLLISRGIARSFEINRVSCTLVGLEPAFRVVLEDIRENRARNIARFSPKLYLRDQAKAILSVFGFQTLGDKISHDPGLL